MVSQAILCTLGELGRKQGEIEVIKVKREGGEGSRKEGGMEGGRESESGGKGEGRERGGRHFRVVDRD